jgi:F0F1-type ATP synthase membrane subunit b/b'
MLLIFIPEWVDTYLNYPGLELWKFGDLAIFVTAAIIVLRKPLKNALLARGEAIKREILTAQAERDTAAAKLAEAETLLAHVDVDVQTVREQARQEAELERQRQALAADIEIEKLKAQGARQLEMAGKTARKGLQEFLANRSIELARKSVVNQLRPEDDIRLIRQRVAELGRTKS